VSRAYGLLAPLTHTFAVYTSALTAPLLSFIPSDRLLLLEGTNSYCILHEHYGEAAISIFFFFTSSLSLRDIKDLWLCECIALYLSEMG